MVVSVGRIFDDKKTLRQKLGKMNCEKLFDNLVKTISKRRKINSSRLTQTGHSNQKEGHRLIEKMILPPWDLKNKEEQLAYCQQFFTIKSIIDEISQILKLKISQHIEEQRSTTVDWHKLATVTKRKFIS